MSTAVYVRVSTTDQNPEGQRKDIQRWLKGNGVTDVTWFVDRETGNHLDRPEFAKLQSAIFHGEIETVVVWQLDRLSRSLRDGINTLGDWLKKGVRLVSTTQLMDFSGSTGGLIASVLFAVAEIETSTRRERQAAGISAARDRGVYRGRKPGTKKADASRAVSLREKGNTVAEIATAMGISLRTVARYLKLQNAR